MNGQRIEILVSEDWGHHSYRNAQCSQLQERDQRDAPRQGLSLGMVFPRKVIVHFDS